MKIAFKLICFILPLTCLWADNVHLKSFDANFSLSPHTTIGKNINEESKGDLAQLTIRALNISESYATNQNHNISIEIENNGPALENLKLESQLPDSWKITSLSTINRIEANSKKMILFSFFIPAKASAGEATIILFVKETSNNNLLPTPIDLTIAANYELEVIKVFASKNVQAGETIKAAYVIKNIGNTAQEVILSGKGEVEGATTLLLAPGNSQEIKVTLPTNKNLYSFGKKSTHLYVYSQISDKTYRAFSSTEVFPSKIKRKDPFYRYNMRASLLYNSFTNRQEHYSTLSSELLGDGYLDTSNEHYLNFSIRAPKQDKLKRFGMADQYSLLYKFKDKTTIHLGDHSYFINRLGFNSRYGMGFRVDQIINKWELSIFYSKPRLYTYNSEPIYGAKAVYSLNNNLNIGIAIERSKGTTNSANPNIEDNADEKGQINTLSLDYINNFGTHLNIESSLSTTNKGTDHAQYFNLRQRYKNLSYTGTLTVAGKNYFGALTNSLQFSNGLNYKLDKFNISLGHSQSKVNSRLDPLFYFVEPFYETLYGAVSYRFSKRSSISIRADKRTREDQMETKNYFYKEYGGSYRYKYTSPLFSINFMGRIAQTKNLLAADNLYKTTYAHSLNSTVKIDKNFSIRGNISHYNNNRYGVTNNSSNYFRYGFGVNYNLAKYIRLNLNYTSGFSPEESYLKRDYITGNINIKASKNHHFELRGSYFENPGETNNKHFLGSGKYTYNFGVPLKRILDQGGLTGHILYNEASESAKGIKVHTAGKTLVTDGNGKFELNNLPTGKNYIFVEDSSLPLGTVIAAKMPLEVTIEKNGNAAIKIPLVLGATLSGKLLTTDARNGAPDQLEGYLELKNENFTYTLSSKKNGEFEFKNIVPGSYTLSLIRYIGDEYFELENEMKIEVASGKTESVNVPVKGKTRLIEFKKKNFILKK